MATSQLGRVMQRLRTATLSQDGAGLSDGHLLGSFLEQRDEAAFAALVRRHGPMVWNVCRRVLRTHHDAEDAFQATFLVLVRRAASVRPREMVANWLYGVACRTARKARANAGRRQGREKQVAVMPEPVAVDDDLWRDLEPVLDQELSRLPDKYRAALVLCDLEGKTRKEAARQLGIPEGTVSSRLTTARAKLARRLAGHGFAPAAGVLVLLLSGKARSAAVPASIVSGTVRVGGALAPGQAAAPGVVSAKVAALTEGVLKVMMLNRLKIGLALLLAAAVAGVVGLGGVTLQAPAAEQAGKAGADGQTPDKKEKPAQDNTPPGSIGALVRAVEGKVVVEKVLPDSPAAKAGLQEGDVILKLGDDDVSDLPAFVKKLRRINPGDEARFQVERKVKVKVGPFLYTPEKPKEPGEKKDEGRPPKPPEGAKEQAAGSPPASEALAQALGATLLLDVTYRGRAEHGSAIAVIVDRPLGYLLSVRPPLEGLEEVTARAGDASACEVAQTTWKQQAALALLRLKSPPEGRVRVRFADPGSYRVGSEVWVVRHSRGEGADDLRLVPAIVTATDREVALDGANSLKGLLQIDQPVEAGSPLVSPDGKLVGIGIPAPGRAGGPGFALPADAVEDQYDDLRVSFR